MPQYVFLRICITEAIINTVINIVCNTIIAIRRFELVPSTVLVTIFDVVGDIEGIWRMGMYDEVVSDAVGATVGIVADTDAAEGAAEGAVEGAAEGTAVGTLLTCPAKFTSFSIAAVA